ncbi:MAG TPA: hypothetical protein G4N97_00110 [Thermoflexia bacterium]|nr:MAG: hypothetical protein DRI80_18635 [Chloroflexota bacterium]HEY66658.1 hypothetical protein [Thermoflexia bacterium]
MIPLNTLFWGLVLLFGLIGALRGWAKEIVVAFSVLLSLFIQQVVGYFILKPDNPYIPPLWSLAGEAAIPGVYNRTQFYVCVALLCLLTLFGYAGPTLAHQVGTKIARERLQDMLLGFFLGLLNGYLIIGTLWFYLDKSAYAIGGITAPVEGSVAWILAKRYLPPLLISAPILYIAIGLAFVFVIVVFI